MENKYINRYRSLCRSLENLRQSRGADLSDIFVLPATIQNYNLTFDLSWKVMKEVLLHEYGINDFAAGSPRETLKTGFSVGLIQDDRWLEMLRVRNTLAHDYDGQVANRYYENIIGEYFDLMEMFVNRIKGYYDI